MYVFFVCMSHLCLFVSFFSIFCSLFLNPLLEAYSQQYRNRVSPLYPPFTSFYKEKIPYSSSDASFGSHWSLSGCSHSSPFFGMVLLHNVTVPPTPSSFHKVYFNEAGAPPRGKVVIVRFQKYTMLMWDSMSPPFGENVVVVLPDTNNLCMKSQLLILIL